jgi:hypothetical protein
MENEEFNEYNDPTPIATPEEFKQALLKVRDRYGISPKELAMLKAQCHAPNHTITSQQLAKVLGYSHYIAANGAYGSFADRVCHALGITLAPTRSKEPHWWRTLAIGHVPANSKDDYEWVMRPQLVQALQEMKWA